MSLPKVRDFTLSLTWQEARDIHPAGAQKRSPTILNKTLCARLEMNAHDVEKICD